MPSLIDLRRRVRAVKNTQQITKAMKMVAASKLRRAQERVTNARPYAVEMQRVLTGLVGSVDSSIHPLLAVREVTPSSRTLVIAVTGDKGLCGSFNTNAIKAAAQATITSSTPVVLGLVGRKGKEYFVRRGFAVEFEQIGIFQKLSFANAQAIAALAIDAFTSGRVDKVLLVFNEFRSVISQKVVVDQLLPIPRSSSQVGGQGAADTVEHLYEPDAQSIFDQLLPRYVEVQVYRALLDSNAAFYAAQMTAMDTATRNSADMIGSLTLYMNKVRQAAITREIIEVVSGAQAL
jgi:F-type H+-transporting ATPase subunit gamma